MRRRGNRRSNKGQGKGSSTPSGQKNFESLMKLPADFRKNFHEKYHEKEICFRFQSKSCNLTAEQCKFSHICIGCGGSKLTTIADEKFADVPPTLPVSTSPRIVKPEACQKRVLLLTSETALEAEVRDALRIRQQDGDSALFFELTYLVRTPHTDFLAVLDLLDHVRQGYFDMIHIVPSAATWSRSRHSGLPGQPLLLSRSSPLGLSSLSPEETEKIHSANRVLVTFDVPLATCASSLERTTSVRLASPPIVFNFETVCLWAGPL